MADVLPAYDRLKADYDKLLEQHQVLHARLSALPLEQMKWDALWVIKRQPEAFDIGHDCACHVLALLDALGLEGCKPIDLAEKP